MKKKHKYCRFHILPILCLSAVLILSGCTKQDNPQSSEPSTSSTVGTAPPLLDVDITTLLTTEQVSAALGVKVEEPQLFESNTIAHYATPDLQNTAEVSLMKASKDMFDTMVSEFPEAADTPNLGESAKWISGEIHQLLVYGKGYIINVNIDLSHNNSDTTLTSARQIAALILNNLS